MPPGVVLIVDDDPALRLLLQEVLLFDESYQILEAVDGVDAQRVLRETAVDVVITDLRMPHLDGLGLIRWAHEHCPGPIWIINSGLDTFEMAAEALELSVFAFLPKPRANFDSMRMTVRKALEYRELLRDRETLNDALEVSNAQLREKVEQLESVCELLQRQADVIDEDLRRANRIQRSLLPSIAPVSKRYAFNGFYRPCRNVGGDLYDVMRLPDGRIAFYVADAAGHGVAAAMLSVLFKHRLRVFDEQKKWRMPAQVLADINAVVMAECAGRGLFLTVVYGVLDSDTGDAVLASAGHPPVVVHRRRGGTEQLGHTGPALGLQADPSFGEHRVRFGDGDRLLLYTDGVFCPVPGGEPRTADDVAAALLRVEGDGQNALRQVHLAGRAQNGNGVDGAPREDDVTMLLVTAGGGKSTVDHGEAAIAPSAAIGTELGAELLTGQDNGTAYISIRGRGIWNGAGAFLNECEQQLADNRPLVLDFSGCSYLDSTFLGTIHEVVVRAEEASTALTLTGVGAEVRGLFEELHMSDVLEHLGADQALPARLHPLPVAGSLQEARRRVLAAHVALAGINDEQSAQLLAVADAIRAESGDP